MCTAHCAAGALYAAQYTTEAESQSTYCKGADGGEGGAAST